MVGGIVEVFARIALKGMEIFSEERKRHFQSEYHDVIAALNEAINRKFPTYTDARVVLSEERLMAFYEAYEREQSGAVDRLKDLLRGVK